MVAMSPLPLLPRVTPQSTRMCLGPSDEGRVTRKKSPKPTRYMRTRSDVGALLLGFDAGLEGVLVLPARFGAAFLLLLVLAMSVPSVGESEVDLEPARIAPFDEAETLEVASLASLTLFAEAAVQVFGDDVADVAKLRALLVSFLLADFGNGRLGDDQDGATANGERAQAFLSRVEEGGALLQSFDDHVGSQAAVLVDPENRVKRREADGDLRIEAEHAPVGV